MSGRKAGVLYLLETRSFCSELIRVGVSHAVIYRVDPHCFDELLAAIYGNCKYLQLLWILRRTSRRRRGEDDTELTNENRKSNKNINNLICSPFIALPSDEL